MSTDGGPDAAEPRPARVLRMSRWDRPPPPHDWRWAVGHVGRVLIAVGLLMFGFVAYQLWGTGIEYRQSQSALEDEFADLLAAAPAITGTPATTAEPTTAATVPSSTVAATAPTAPTTTPPTTSLPTTTTTTTTVAPPTFEPGDPIARMEIPSIGLDAVVVSGVAPNDLQKGPGHYPGTPMPGELGNAAIAGHRTTWGQPFYRIDEIQPGDEVILTTLTGRFVYRMTTSEIVSPERSDVVATTDETVAQLTLTSCHPRYTASQRIVVHADLDVEASTAPAKPKPRRERPDRTPPSTLPGEDVPSTAPPSSVATATTSVDATGVNVGSTTTTATTTTTTTIIVGDDGGEGGATIEDAFGHGWFSDSAAFPQVALWGFIVSAIAIGTYAVSRSLRRNWVGALVGIAPFVVALYFFYQNVNRLLPSAI